MLVGKLNVYIRNSASAVGPLRLLESLAAPPGDMAMLYSGADEAVVLATRPIAGVLLEPRGNQLALRCSGLAATAGRTDIVVPRPDVWTSWQTLLAGTVLLPSAPNLVGWLGWISYEAGVIHELPQLYPAQAEAIPLAHWQLFERYFVFHVPTQQWRLVALNHELGAAMSAIDDMESELAASATPGIIDATSTRGSEFLQSPDLAQFKSAVRRCREYIAAGDIYQANISALWTAQSAVSGPRIFARLIRHNPAQYAAFIRYGGHEIISASPELFINRKGHILETRPIKGTRRRDVSNPDADQQLRDELLHSQKDRAELAMIVDLLRNDLGRVCAKVQVRKVREMEQLPTLWHTYGIITGELNLESSPGWDRIIAAICPGGSITGAPKIRAMRIIQELEGQARGIYCGNIGWISPSGDGTLNIAIRTIHLANGLAQFRSGGGITADSDPDEECAEIIAKAAALLRAIA
ncbi:MAG: anthranilate synthase component I family protein [Phycisphaerae bacterium]